MESEKLTIEDWRKAMSFYWRYTAPVMKKIWYIWPIWCVLLLSNLMEPYVYQKVFDGVVNLGRADAVVDTNQIWFFLLLWGAVLLGSALLMIAIRLIFGLNMPLVDRIYFQEAMAKVMDFDLSYHLAKKSGEMMKKVDRGVDGFWSVTMLFVNDVFPKLLLSIIVFIWAIYINWKMTMVAIICYPLAIYVFFVGFKKTSDLQNKSNNIFDKALGRAYDAVANIMVVKSFAREKKESSLIMSKLDKYIALQKQASVRWGRMDIYAHTISSIQRILLIGFGIYLIIQGSFTVGQLIMFVLFQRYLYDPIYSISGALRNLQYQVLRLNEARKIVDRIPVVRDEPNAGKLKVSAGKIEFKNLSFKYQTLEVLRKVNITFEPGQITALVGHSGAGKSTVTALINRFYDVQKGQVLIDGQDITKVTQKSLRQNIGMVMQENSLFNDTIYNNIRYAKPGAKRKEIIEAAKQAQIHKFIMKQPKKYQTVVGERGLKLSGGEKQRVAIARAILKDPPILILDEATSALDSKNEKDIQIALNKLMKGRTSIIIAHRLSTVRHADQIFVIEDGVLVQKGKHADLINEKGVYQDLVKLQTEGLLAA